MAVVIYWDLYLTWLSISSDRVGLDVSDEDGIMELLKRGKVLRKTGRSKLEGNIVEDSHTSAGVGAG